MNEPSHVCEACRLQISVQQASIDKLFEQRDELLAACESARLAIESARFECESLDTALPTHVRLAFQVLRENGMGIDTLKSQRDELLAACEGALGIEDLWLPCVYSDPKFDEKFETLLLMRNGFRDAIKKAKGE